MEIWLDMITSNWLFYVQTLKFIYIIIHSGWSLAWIFMKHRVLKDINMIQVVQITVTVNDLKFWSLFSFCCQIKSWFQGWNLQNASQKNKQGRPWSNCFFEAVWSGSALFVKAFVQAITVCNFRKSTVTEHISQHLRFWYMHVLQWQAAKAQTSWCMWAILPEHLLLAYTKYGCRSRLRTKCRPLDQLDTPELVFEKGFFTYAISTK